MAKKAKPRSITTPEEKPQIRRVEILSSGVLRIILFAAIAVGASVYGVVRHFTHPFKSMLAPPPTPEPEIEILFDDDGGRE